MKIVNRKISELKPAEYNPRKITDKQFSDLKKSLKKLDILQPAVININVDRKNIIIGGHQRIRAAEALGKKEYPCIEVDFPIDKEREACIRMNKNTGDFDEELLSNHFDLDDLVYFGFEPKELDFDDGSGEPKTKRKTETTMTCPECDHVWTK